MKHGSTLLKKWRDAHKLSQRGAAEKLGIRHEQVCRYERSAVTPSYRAMIVLQKMCSIPLSAWDNKE